VEEFEHLKLEKRGVAGQTKGTGETVSLEKKAYMMSLFLSLLYSGQAKAGTFPMGS